jgi:ornithine cyclodeaminase/alanine dehydrogenase-like protein (mu-crystallin family)
MMSKLLIAGEEEIERLLPMSACIAAMESALSALARGEVHQPLRQIVRASGAEGMLGLMPAYLGGSRPFYGLKEVCVFPANPKKGLDTHLGAVLLHDGTNGQLLAVMNASTITAIRTAAVSALATRLLAREDASVLAIIGAGVQARSHLRAIPLVRPIREVRIHSRSVERVAEMMNDAADVDVELITYASSVEEAVDGADVIVTATSSREPVLEHGWVSPGSHINAVGSSISSARELSGKTMASGSLFVDRRESTVNESGDYLMALAEGAIRDDHIRGEIGEILIGKATGRSSSSEITIFKSLGLAVEDLGAAITIFEAAKSARAGTWIEF